MLTTARTRIRRRMLPAQQLVPLLFGVAYLILLVAFFVAFFATHWDRAEWR